MDHHSSCPLLLLETFTCGMTPSVPTDDGMFSLDSSAWARYCFFCWCSVQRYESFLAQSVSGLNQAFSLYSDPILSPHCGHYSTLECSFPSISLSCHRSLHPSPNLRAGSTVFSPPLPAVDLPFATTSSHSNNTASRPPSSLPAPSARPASIIPPTPKEPALTSPLRSLPSLSHRPSHPPPPSNSATPPSSLTPPSSSIVRIPIPVRIPLSSQPSHPPPPPRASHSLSPLLSPTSPHPPSLPPASPHPLSPSPPSPIHTPTPTTQTFHPQTLSHGFGIGSGYTNGANSGCAW